MCHGCRQLENVPCSLETRTMHIGFSRSESFLIAEVEILAVVTLQSGCSDSFVRHT
jgi:hypothetical protein